MTSAGVAGPRTPAADQLVEDLARFVSFPSVGADPRRSADVAAAYLGGAGPADGATGD